jgi:osmotically inducible lipoprotein OsmB
MRKLILVAAMAPLLAGCAGSTRGDHVAGGALVGAGTGAVIGGVATRSVGGAVAGGVIGAAAGGLIGAAAAPPEPCYVRTRTGRLRRVEC